MSWCTIESDPGVFSEIISSLGVRGVSVEEIYSLDDSSQSQPEPSHGLIFLFKWRQEEDPREVLDPYDVPGLFFARQVVPNACATQAILSVLLSSQDIDIGDELRAFKSFTIDLDSESRGMAIGSSDNIRLVHNSFARNEPFMTEESKQSYGEKEDVYHFVAYLPHQGRVYEIDGLKQGPIYLGETNQGQDWLTIAKPAIEARMQRYASSETHFALLTIRPKKTTLLENEINALEERLRELSVTYNEEEDNEVKEVSREIQERISELRGQLNYELSNIERQRQENIRRRHNYVPFIVTLLKHLSSKNQLKGLIERGIAREASQAQNKRQKNA